MSEEVEPAGERERFTWVVGKMQSPYWWDEQADALISALHFHPKLTEVTVLRTTRREKVLSRAEAEALVAESEQVTDPIA